MARTTEAVDIKSTESPAAAKAGSATGTGMLPSFQEMERLMESFMGPDAARHWVWPFNGNGSDPMERMLASLRRGIWSDHWLTPQRWSETLLQDWTNGALTGPRLDVLDRDEELVVQVEVPGATREDIHVSVGGGTLNIKGEQRVESDKGEGEYHRHERRLSSFQRSVSLPVAVDDSKATARLDKGVLEVHLPKAAGAKRRSIEIE